MTEQRTARNAPAQPLPPAPGELVHSIAPMPTAHTIRMRTSLPYQVYRFACVNLRMMKMIRRSHTG